MNEELNKLPSKFPLEQLDVGSFSRDKLRDLFRTGKMPTPEMMIDEIILRTVKSGATDLHIEPLENELRIRLGTEGVIKRLVSLPRDIADNLANVLKTKAGLNAFEKKKPQEGRFSQTIGNEQFDIRINTVPVMSGERFMLRFFHKSTSIASVEELGFSPENLKKFRALLHRPTGLLLVAGPSSSGKSTTLYAAIKDVQSDANNIITVENPIEYRLDFASQITPPSDKSFTFPQALQAALRQNPNIILVGEIRDSDTGIAAAEAALTGSLVLSSMLSGDAIGAIHRLLNIGVPPYWLSSTLIGIVYQQLVRKICDGCKEEYKPNPDELMVLLNIMPGQKMFHRGKGCEKCDSTGYHGRTAVHEVLVINDKLRDLIYQQGSILKLKEAARSAGFQDIFQDAIKKVANGTTSIAEFARALG